MQQRIVNNCELLGKSWQLLKQNFKWDSSEISLGAAAIYTTLGLEPDIAKMTECRQILKSSEGLFSEFRGMAEIIVLCKMALTTNPQQYLENLKITRDALSAGKLFSTEYQLLAALSICDNAAGEEAVRYAEKTLECYKKMKQAHPFLTAGEDYPFAALLALSPRSTEIVMDDVEQCFTLLKQYFGSNDPVQTLSHVLALSDAPAASKTAACTNLFEVLKKNGQKFGQSYDLTALGCMALTGADPQILTELFITADEHLKAQKGFSGLLGVSTMTRRLLAAHVVTTTLAPGNLVCSSVAINQIVQILNISQTDTSIALM